MVETNFSDRWNLVPAQVRDGFDPSTIASSSLTRELRDRHVAAPPSRRRLNHQALSPRGGPACQRPDFVVPRIGLAVSGSAGQGCFA